MNAKNILFDLDGTLTNPQVGTFNSIRYALKEMNISEGEVDLCSFIGPPLVDSFQAYYGMDEGQALEAVDHYRANFAENGMLEASVYAGVEMMLTALKEAGYKIYLATSKPLVFATEILRHFNLLPLFDGLSGADLDGSRNEKKEVIAFLLTVYGLETSECVMVGDRMFDVQGAAAHGIKTIGVTYGFGSPDELRDNGAVALVDSVSGLQSFFLN